MKFEKNVPTYVIWGAGSRGKTTLFSHLVNFMLINGGEVLYPQPYGRIDYPNIIDHCMIVEYERKVYCIMSKGDNDGELDNQYKVLEEFNDKNIDIIIGASRTSGATNEWWQWWEKEEEAIKVIWQENNENIVTYEAQQKYHYAQLEEIKNLLKI